MMSWNQGQNEVLEWARRVLLSGTVFSFAVMVIGLGYTIVAGTGGDADTVSPPRLLADLLALKPSAIVGVGVVALLLTPVTNVLVMAALFARERDRAFALVALLVLGIMAISAGMAMK